MEVERRLTKNPVLEFRETDNTTKIPVFTQDAPRVYNPVSIGALHPKFLPQELGRVR